MVKNNNKDADFGLPKVDNDNKNTNRKSMYFLLFTTIIILLGLGYWFFMKKKEASDFLAKRTDDLVNIIDKVDEVVNETKPTNEVEVNEKVIKNNEGTITIIKKPQSLYYVVINSFVDNDLALDFAKKLKKSGENCYIIEPNPKRNMGYYYVCLVETNSLAKVSEALSVLSNTYQKSDLWFLKY